MGSASSRRPPKRQNKIRRLPRGGPHIDPTAFGTPHSAYTIEGRIEAVGQFARGANYASSAQWRFVQRLALGFGVALVVVFVLFLLADWIF